MWKALCTVEPEEFLQNRSERGRRRRRGEWNVAEADMWFCDWMWFWDSVCVKVLPCQQQWMQWPSGRNTCLCFSLFLSLTLSLCLSLPLSLPLSLSLSPTVFRSPWLCSSHTCQWCTVVRGYVQDMVLGVSVFTQINITTADNSSQTLLLLWSTGSIFICMCLTHTFIYLNVDTTSVFLLSFQLVQSVVWRLASAS